MCSILQPLLTKIQEQKVHCFLILLGGRCPKPSRVLDAGHSNCQDTPARSFLQAVRVPAWAGERGRDPAAWWDLGRGSVHTKMGEVQPKP